MKIEINIPEGKSGEWEISKFSVSKSESDSDRIRSGSRYVPAGEYVRLMRGSVVVMSNTPSEIDDHSMFIRKASQSENVLINGLGIGVALKKILESEKVKSVTVIENSEDVIRLVSPYITDSRVKIINDCAFSYQPPKGVR